MASGPARRRSSSTRVRSMMRPSRLVSTLSLVATPVSRKTGAMANWMMWPMSLICIFMKLGLLEVFHAASVAAAWTLAGNSVETPVALELLGRRHQRLGNAAFERAVAGIRDHPQARARPGLLQAPGRQRRADHVVAPLHDHDRQMGDPA